MNFLFLCFCKVAKMQNFRKFFFSFIYIRFDRAWKADDEYIFFFSIRLLFSSEKLLRSWRTKKHNFSIKFTLSKKTTKYFFQVSSKIFKTYIFWISVKNGVEWYYLSGCTISKTKKIILNINRPIKWKSCASVNHCKCI